MKFSFKDKELENLYIGKKSKLRKKLSKKIIEKFLRKVYIIEASEDIYDLRKPPSNKFEKLKGNDLFSIRIDRAYRLEFTISFTNQEKTKGNVKIIRISNHYK